ncbi:MAG: hypothetical protein FJX60_10930 [Alphaproteobacteria bacterium]|nr:hypothetical protein [Alphaproteobacteria bacterium]
MIVRRIRDLQMLVAGLPYLAGYVLLDWISFIDPIGPSGITPWNPSTGLSFAFVLVFGRKFLPFLFLAPLLANLIAQGETLPLPIQLGAAAVVGGGYAAVLATLMRPGIGFDPALTTIRDLFVLLSAAAAGPLLVALSYVCLMTFFGPLPSEAFVSATATYWVGDTIGIIVVAPFALIALTRPQALRPTLETGFQLAAVLAALILILGLPSGPHIQLFYLLFIPIVWMAVRSGIEGVCVGILTAQIILVVLAQLLPQEAIEISDYQTRMIIIAGTGLIAGALVNERRRAEIRLRRHQESLANVERLGSLGEFAAALAHEINQPLMAAGTYTRLVANALQTGEGDAASVADAGRKAAAQVERAAEVVRRIRALVKLDRNLRAPCHIEVLVSQAVELCQSDLDRAQVRVHVVRPASMGPMMVDYLQVQQVLINLFRNSIEAIEASGKPQRQITVEISEFDPDFVQVNVRDTGPGFEPSLLADPFLPFSSTKADGLGIGLSLCKSIVESHGGRLTMAGGPAGAIVTFTLPLAKEVPA